MANPTTYHASAGEGNARFAGNLEIGSRIQLIGRIQSREYQKRVSENELIRRVAYEVSVNKLEFHEKDEE